RTGTSHPKIGVQRPTTRSNPVTNEIRATKVEIIQGSVRSLISAGDTSAIPATTRSSRRPTPGQPNAKVENRRRTITSYRGYRIDEIGLKPQMGISPTL